MTILRTTHASQFFTDAAPRGLPASWQDTGSGLFALTTTTVLLGTATPGPAGTAHDSLSTLCGLVAFLVDVYLY